MDILSEIIKAFAVRFQFEFFFCMEIKVNKSKEICIEIKNNGVYFCKISYFLSLGANLKQNILAGSIFF